METLEFSATFGNEVKKVKVSRPPGGPDAYFVMVGNYFTGNIFYQDGQWQAHLAPGSELTMDDIQILGDLIDKQIKKPGVSQV